MTAALAVVAFASVGDLRAQNPNDPRYQKKAPPKAAVQPPRKGAVMPGAPPMRPGFTNRGPAVLPGRPVGPNALPNNARINPAIPNMRPGVQPFAKGPNAVGPNTPGLNAKGPQGFTKGLPNARDPRNAFGPKGQNPNAKAASTGNPGARFGNTPGGRFGNTPGAFNNRMRGFTNRDPRLRVVNAATPQMRQFQRTTHRTDLFAMRRMMPVRPLPGERGFTGVPPVTETRYVQTEMVCQWGPDITPERIEQIARQHNLTILAIERSALTGSTLVQFAIGGNRPARDVVRAMEAERIVSQPNYVYLLNQDQAEPASAQSGEGSSDQYVVNKLRLADVHKVATGKDVLIAVIDSQVDSAHPELANAVAETFNATDKAEAPHSHGTGMASAIASRSRLMGIAPGAKVLAVQVFSTTAQQSPQATTRNIVAGLEWAVAKGARIINMSFAGPSDPMLQLAIKKAHEKGAILIAAVGNQGPKSPPLYPAADPNVIGVTATDDGDKLYKGANRGTQVAVAAPGVDIMAAAPAETYQLTTGTSVAAAHVSGVIALMMEKYPKLDSATALEVLTGSATRLGSSKREDVGFGLIDPLAALKELDARLSDTQVAGTSPATAPAAATPAPIPTASRPPTMTPAAAAAKPALPRPGIYVPKQ